MGYLATAVWYTFAAISTITVVYCIICVVVYGLTQIGMASVDTFNSMTFGWFASYVDDDKKKKKSIHDKLKPKNWLSDMKIK
jgi:hypothetical protein